ncbi:MAG: ATP synthase subunit I [Pseudomonadota bacterium]
MQTLFGVTLALMTLLISADFAVSTLLGALIGVVPNAYLALRIFGKEPSVEVQTLASRIYVGETLKIILTIALFVVVMKLFAANVVGVLAGYLATFVANWVALLVVDLSETT